MAISPQWASDDNRYLFFHSLASIDENVVRLSSINNPSIWNSNPNSQPNAFWKIGERGIQTASKKNKFLLL